MTDDRVLGAMWLGVGAAVVSAITGAAIALQSRVVECADGTSFPEGASDFRCFEHPRALEGTAAIAISIAVGVLVFLVGTAIRAGMVSGTPTE